MAEKKSFWGYITHFYHKHPVLVHAILIIFTGLVLIWLVNDVFLKMWTRHGSVVEVPDVKGMQVGEAEKLLVDSGYEVSLDSLYDSAGRSGAVLEQNPVGGAVVKEGRTVYLTYACYSQKLVKVPNYENMSRRQAISAFEERGITNITVREVPSAYPELVIAAKYNGLFLHPKQEIPITANVVLEVGAPVYDEYGREESHEELILPEEEDFIFDD